MSDLITRHRATADALRHRPGNAAAAQCKFHSDTADEIERLRAALEGTHDVLANGGDLKTDTYQTRCNRALAITREALNKGEEK